MNYALLAVGMIICSVLAVRSVRLLSAALWLAGVSVLTSIMLYLIGAHVIAVIELSLSVGLITVLLVVAISMVGAESSDQPVSKYMNWPLVIMMILLILGLVLPLIPSHTTVPQSSVSTIFWQQRQADILAQIAMIFAGVMGILGLLVESRSDQNYSTQVVGQSESDRRKVLPSASMLDQVHEPEQEQV